MGRVGASRVLRTTTKPSHPSPQGQTSVAEATQVLPQPSASRGSLLWSCLPCVRGRTSAHGPGRGCHRRSSRIAILLRTQSAAACVHAGSPSHCDPWSLVPSSHALALSSAVVCHPPRWRALPPASPCPAWRPARALEPAWPARAHVNGAALVAQRGAPCGRWVVLRKCLTRGGPRIDVRSVQRQYSVCLGSRVRRY